MPNQDPNAARRRAEAAEQRADRLKAEAERRSQQASNMYGRFAGGQPLLRGHHSYRSARRDKARADAASERAIDAFKEAQRADQHARWARITADAKTEMAERLSKRDRSWTPADFQPGDIVGVRTFQTSVDTYRVKRVNKKTLTLDGGGGGWDDPKREYDRVLSRTRDGVTVTNPADLD
ncbi:DUF3560 domain-containing protein [Streptomyces sp. NPDC015130]|uniref:DUF3560 domain-containing protein n=1 Tax=Streptomyces sp. NPDC015130 TaxID=3364940 RepID=UPI0036F92E5E